MTEWKPDDDETEALIHAAHHFKLPPILENDDFLRKSNIYQEKLLQLRLRAFGREVMRLVRRAFSGPGPSTTRDGS